MPSEFETTGVVRDKRIIELDEEMLVPKGHRVRVRLLVPDGSPMATAESEMSPEEVEASFEEVRRWWHDQGMWKP